MAIEIPSWVGTVRTFWTIIGSVLAVVGISLPFLAPDFFTVGVFDLIVDGIVAILGIVIALYQRVRAPQAPDSAVSLSGVTTLSHPVFGDVVSFALNPFRRYAIK